jgi:hypothetical protein
MVPGTVFKLCSGDADDGHMTPSNGTRIAAAVAAAALLLPGTALAGQRKSHKHHRSHAAHKVRTSVSIPQPTIVVPHVYDAGGDGLPYGSPLPSNFAMFDPVAIAKALGNDALAELGLPPLPG